MLILIPLLAYSVGFFMLTRQVMILTGQLKGPVLSCFEVYGERERAYHPIPQLLGWSGFLLLVSGELIGSILRFDNIAVILGLVSVGSAFLLYHYRESLATYDHLLPTLPTWYRELCRETTRHERRRIAYLWLRLPLRTRMIYNISDRLFFRWAELVILSTL